MTKHRYIIFFIFFLGFDTSYAQKTPQELGKIVFEALKSRNFVLLDTLTPKATDIVEILKKKYPTIKIDTSDRFLKKYLYHDSQFKKICQDIRNDTTGKIDWDKSSLSKVDFFEKRHSHQDTTEFTTPILVNYLELYITSETSTSVLEFKEIYFHKGIWKLGEHIRVSPLSK